ncbi:MAG TPA: glycosyltransferase family 39 protein, partial [Candidatus Omnitrophota bacterium]|nr:glycosyltransferase family 39 protein [Candidatus Omnitrophota bacterium]
MKKDILILIFLSAIIFLSALGSGSLSSWDEAFYAQVSREMFERGDWLHLYWGGASWNDKPPMYMWVTCVFYELFGVNEFSARLFSALSGTALVVFTYLLGLRFFGRRTGFIAAVMMMSSYHFILFAKSGTLDVASAMFITGAIYFLGRDKEAGWHTVTAFMLFSLAFLTKSFAALLVPVIFTGYVAITGKWRLIFNRYAFVGAVISFLTLGLWHYSAFSSDGNFVGGYFIQHLFQRTTQAMDGHTGNWLTYINVVLYKAKPWGSVGIVALLFFVISSIKKKETEKWLFIVWIVATYAIFTAVKTKLHWYIIPVYP